jgi:type IX secretion system PorP/SprF family membrane protein
MKQCFLLIFIYILDSQTLYSQDYHFSQLENTKMTLNPANTGNFSGKIRLLSLYRSQWEKIGEPFQTGLFYLDFPILKKRLKESNYLAVGFSGMFDKSSGGLLKSNEFSASVAYHLYLDKEKFHKISAGFQTAFSSRKIDFQNISFANQFSSFGFDLSLPNNQNFISTLSNNFDFSSGFLYSYNSEQGGIYIGCGIFNLNQPNVSFLGDNKNTLPLRYNWQFGANKLFETNGELKFQSLMSLMGKESDLTFGLSYNHTIENYYHNMKIEIGSFFRLNESFIPYLGYSYDSFQIGLSYDIVKPSLTVNNFNNQSFEISLLFHFHENGLRN